MYLAHHELDSNLVVIVVAISILIVIIIITPHQCMYLVQSGGQGTGSSQGAGLEQRIQQTLQGAGSALQQSLRSIQGKHTQQHCTVSGGIAKHIFSVATYSLLYCS